MSQTKQTKKIRLNREVLKNLTQEQARKVIGGAKPSRPYACESSDDPTAC
jgi:hypothetical protein